MQKTNRNELILSLSEKILNIKKDFPVLIGINGIDASGKTTLAREITEQLKQSTRHIIAATIDGFHNTEKLRYAKGKDSPVWYYQNSFNNEAIKNALLDPLCNWNLEYNTVAFDYRSDSSVEPIIEKANNNSILIMEWIFLFRPELVDYRDLKIFVDIDFEDSIQRAIERQAEKDHIWSEQAIIDRYNKRYIPWQKLYIQAANPIEISDIVIDNRIFETPKIIKG